MISYTREQLEERVRELHDDFDDWDQLSQQIAIALAWKELRGDPDDGRLCALPTLAEMIQSGAIELAHDTPTHGSA